ncbi:MAG: hypothetical protein DMG81_02065 [Acidobacteria bacterium]|nr:MAG: hypothetical protein DMG81_02065 [Acidobacteriota bacterium]
MLSRSVVPQGSRTERLLASTVMALGIGLRVAQYLNNRSLWGDEIAVALNLRLRTFSGLFHPLSYDQTMPFGLLLLLKAMGSVFGYSEWALRLPLLLGGCALTVLAWFLYHRIFEQRVVLLFAALLAISEPLIYYSGEVKQYGLDALVTLLVLWAAITTLRSENSRGWPRLIVTGMAALLFSQPVIFILAAIGGAAVYDRRFRSSSEWRKNALLAAIVWLLGFGLLYWLSYRGVSHNAFMRAYWEPKFLDPHVTGFRQHLATALIVLLGDTQILWIPKLLLCALFVAGVLGIASKMGLPFAGLAVAPFALVLLASSLRQYPIVVRLVLFLAPVLFWIYANGFATLADLVPERSSNLVFILLASLFLLPSLTHAWHFRQREGSRDVVRKIENQNKTAAVYVVFGHYASWEYYAGDWSHPDLIKQRIDLADRCLREAQLGYAIERDERGGICPHLDFQGSNRRPVEIVGTPPPGPWNGEAADQQWLHQETSKIVSSSEPLVWLFLPDQANHVTYGFPEQRRLLEKLETELNREGCQTSERDAKGETRAIQLRCPSQRASNNP